MNWSEIDCWVVTDGKPGMENQCLGLAEALGARTTVKRIAVAAPWRWLSPWPVPAPLTAVTPALAPPWPRLLIASGRQSAGPSIHVRKAAAGRCFTVQIQNPATAHDRFDLIVPPRHDGLSGANVLPTRGALHRVTPARLAAEAERWRPALAHLPRPLVAVLVGGANAAYRLGPEEMTRLAAELHPLDASFAVTPSRRTDPAAVAALRAGLPAERSTIWDGSGENPYFAYLGLADYVVVTCDSVSMTSEALATGKPVFVVPLPGGNRKFRAFHDALVADGLSRLFAGRLDRWTYTPPDDTGMVAAEIRRRMGP
jgi:mitochondrial fission protein ELM1